MPELAFNLNGEPFEVPPTMAAKSCVAPWSRVTVGGVSTTRTGDSRGVGDLDSLPPHEAKSVAAPSRTDETTERAFISASLSFRVTSKAEGARLRAKK
jgi:hypothetical protein